MASKGVTFNARSASASVIPAPRATVLAAASSMRFSGAWASESMIIAAPAALATPTTWPLVMLCPILPVISMRTPFSLARRASSGVRNPGWARTSMSGFSTEQRLVPGYTGSTTVSPWTTIHSAPNPLAASATLAILQGGTWVISTPGMTSM